MLRLYIFASLFIFFQGYALKSDIRRHGRIVGGVPADITEAPYQVGLLYDVFEVGLFYVACGGSIISENVVLSSATCPEGTKTTQWHVRAGSTFAGHGGQLNSPSKIVMHPNYDNKIYDYDISLYFLTNPFTIDGINTVIVPLPIQGQEVEDGARGLITGWGGTQQGGTSVEALRKVIVPIVNQDVCKNAYVLINPITDRMICAGNLEEGGQDACRGDAGGPLTIDGVLVGITSWRYGCALPTYPGVSTRVAYFKDWIDSELAFKV